MRILIVSQYFYPENFRINDLAFALREAGHEIVVLTARPSYPKAELFPEYDQRPVWHETIEGISVYRVPIWKRTGGGRLELSLNYLTFVLAAIFLGLPRIWRKPFDVQVVWATSPITACLPAILQKWLKRTPIAIWIQDLWPEVVMSVGAVRTPFLITLLGGMVDFIYRQCNALMAQSSGFAAAIIARGISEEKVTVVPNWGIEPNEVFGAQSPPQAQALREIGNFKILYAGNIGKAQDLETVLRAAENMAAENVTWIFMGDGSEKARLVEQARALPNPEKFVFLEPCSPELVSRVYAETDAHLITLRRDPVFDLTVPSKVQSCLASGKPILAVIAGSGAEVLQASGAAFCSAPGDPSGLVESVRTLVNLSAGDREKMGKSGRDWYNKFYTKRAVVELIERLLTQLKS